MATKKIVSLFLALLMALGLCVTAGAEEGATITVGFWGSSGEDKAIDAALEGVLEAIPGVKEVKQVQYPSANDFYEKLPGQFVAGTAPDALGWQLGMSEEELNTTAQMDSCCVAPPYQGNGLEGKLLLMAEDTLRGSRYRHLLATVHPDNAASLYTGLHRGYTIAANHVICYGDKVRDILYKELESRNTNMNTTIRAMTPADKDSVMEMMRVFYNSPAVLSNGSDEIFARDIEGCISDNPYVEGYMFEQDGAVQGYGMAAKSFSTEYGRQCIWLEDIYIKAEYRGLGIGSQFIDYITKKYPDALLRLEVEEENARAVHVYKKSGFEFFEYKEMKRE